MKFQRFLIRIFGWKYRYIFSKILFRFDSESVHTWCIRMGERLGAMPGAPRLVAGLFRFSHPSLRTTLAGISLETPVGLAAGFDYEARLPRILPSIGFGWSTVGTITNEPYAGNPLPRLGRLVKSQSLLVNKGFKNLGIDATLARLAGIQTSIPIGISIGMTNTPRITRHEDAVADISAAFKKAEQSSVRFAYYELNISCPNLRTTVAFYEPKRLETLLAALDALSLSKPVFIKMPIEKSDAETVAMLRVVATHRIAGVIIGNLQKDRMHLSLNPAEVARYPKGNFSGAPCRTRSDELVRLAYREVGEKLAIIGCGGIFTTEDAYRKICLGASALQLVTGLIFRGPLVPSEIAVGLAALLKRDGFRTIADAVGIDARN